MTRLSVRQRPGLYQARLIASSHGDVGGVRRATGQTVVFRSTFIQLEKNMMSATTKTLSMLIVMALCLLVPAAVSQADELIDQQQTTVDNYGLKLIAGQGGTNFVQSFVPSVSNVTGVRFNFANFHSGGNFTLGIYNVIGGGGINDHMPTGAAFGFGTMLVNYGSSGFTDNGQTDDEILFPSAVNVTPDTRYAIQAMNSDSVIGFGRSITSDRYLPGDAIRRQAGQWEHLVGNDFAFQTLYIPEPATLGLMTLGGLMLLRRRR